MLPLLPRNIGYTLTIAFIQAIALMRAGCILVVEYPVILVKFDDMQDRNRTIKESVPAPGGQSTINGVLYQMLWCLLRAVKLYVDQVALDPTGQPNAAVLRLEPRSGGDVHEIQDAKRRVVQLKTRSHAGPWSLRDIITDVLPDLYKAVDLQQGDTCYDFVTEGKMGSWQQAYKFFQTLRERKPGNDPLLALDPECEVKFAHGLRPPANDGDSNRADNTTHFWAQEIYTERSLFECIVEHLKTTTAVPKAETLTSTRLKVWHLLEHFRFIDRQALGSIQEEIDALLLALVDRAEQVSDKRGVLLDWLLTNATRGNGVVQPDDLLAQFHLDVTPLTDWVRLRDTGRRILDTTLKSRQYDPTADV